MPEILIPKRKDPHNVDLKKDCSDFVPLDDGTILGDRKYCNLSFQCKQVGMLGQYVEIRDFEDNLVTIEYFCTGKNPIWEDRSENSKAT